MYAVRLSLKPAVSTPLYSHHVKLKSMSLFGLCLKVLMGQNMCIAYITTRSSWGDIDVVYYKVM